MKTKILFLTIFYGSIFGSTNSVAQEMNVFDKYPVYIIKDVVHPSCSYTNDGSITFTFSGGFPPYFINGIQIIGTSYSIDSVSGGNYIFNFSDSDIYTTSDTITLMTPETIELNPTITHVSTWGGNNGAVLLNPSSNDLVFIWSTQNGNGILQGSKDQLTLTKGTYQVEAFNSNGCAETMNITINQPKKPNFNLDFGITATPIGALKANIIYPNPSTGVINLKSEVTEGTVTITNDMGFVVERAAVENISQIQLKGGSYNVQIQFNDGTFYTEQLIVQ